MSSAIQTSPNTFASSCRERLGLYVAAKSPARFDVFNVATDDYITVREIADIAVAVRGLEPGSVNYEFTGGDRGWKGDVPIVRFDVTKIKSLGWRAGRTSAEAVRDGANYVVIGRQVTRADDPARALAEIHRELGTD